MAKATVRPIMIDPAEILATEADEVLVEVDMMVADDLIEAVGRVAEVMTVSTIIGTIAPDPALATGVATGPTITIGVEIGPAM